MALVLTDVDVGSVESDGTGDKARVAFQAVNANNALIETAVDLNTADLAGGKQTLYVPRAAMIPATTNGAAPGQVETTATRPDIHTLDFDATADEYVQFAVGMPKQWDEGTVTFKAFWTCPANDTDGVSWALQAVAIADGGEINTAYGTAVVVDDLCQGTLPSPTVDVTEVLITDESGAVTVDGSPAAGELVYFQVFRDVSDANDTATEDAKLIGVQLFWTNDTINDD